MRRLMLAMAMIVAGAMPALGQIGRGTRAGDGEQPDYWVGLSYGYLGGMTVANTSETWRFGYTSQIRATFEKGIQRDFTLGVSAGFANAPVSVDVVHPTPSGACAFGCQATADVTQVLAFVNGGTGGTGLHGIYNLEVGFSQFSNFQDNTTGNRGSISATDFTFGVGGGIGYRVSPLADVYASEQGDFILDSPIAGSTQASAPRQFTFRVGFRYGF